MAKSKSNTKPVDELNYEEAVLELEQIVDALEGDSSQNSLEEAMKLFERGQALAMRCSELLDAAQLKVQKLAGDELSAFEDESQ
jgi:exodeoxyribonuclease VII small subunit